MFVPRIAGQKQSNRRVFLRQATLGLGTATSLLRVPAVFGQTASRQNRPSQPPPGEIKSIRELLKRATYRREEIDRYLDSTIPNKWAKFDPELGYTLSDCVAQDGIDNSFTIGSYEKDGQRRMVNYADRPCRINAYGNSFTMCHQVSDGETWEEYLAAHLGEPIRNFGVGGYGVYQAYRRMLRHESSEDGVPYVILNVFGIDDHYRSIDAWRHLRIMDWFRRPGRENMFHNNPWVHVRFDPHTGGMVEMPNDFPTPQSLYKLCDEEFVYEHYKDDIVLKMYMATHYGVDVEAKPLQALAEAMRLSLDFNSPAARFESIKALYHHCALQSTIEIIKKTRSFAAQHDKQLMVLLSYATGHIIEACRGMPRPDQPLVDFLKAENVRSVDALAKHMEDYRSFKLDPATYVRRYYNGHYSPAGNHFFAFAIKNEIVDWLEPKPFTYAKKGQAMDFEGYLQK